MRSVLFIVAAAMSLVACSGSSSDLATAGTNILAMSVDNLEACGVDANELERLLALSPSEFDQDVNEGWRPIAERPDCERAAAALLEMFINENAIDPGGSVMHWHVGQLLAFSGDTEAAITWLEISRDADAAQADPTWNLYVDGTVAFLTQDRSALEAATDSLAAIEVSEAEKTLRRQFLEDNPDVVVPDGFVDEPQNLSVLIGLRTCFGEPYSVAYGCQR